MSLTYDITHKYIAIYLVEDGPAVVAWKPWGVPRAPSVPRVPRGIVAEVAGSVQRALQDRRVLVVGDGNFSFALALMGGGMIVVFSDNLYFLNIY